MNWARTLAIAYTVLAATTPLNYVNVSTPNPVLAAASTILMLISLAMFRRGFLAAARIGIPVSGAATAAKLAMAGIVSALVSVAVFPYVRGTHILEYVFLGTLLLGMIVGVVAMAVSVVAGSVRIGRYLRSTALTVLSYVLSISITTLLIAVLMGPHGAGMAQVGLILEGLSATLIAALLFRKENLKK